MPTAIDTVIYKVNGRVSVSGDEWSEAKSTALSSLNSMAVDCRLLIRITCHRSLITDTLGFIFDVEKIILDHHNLKQIIYCLTLKYQYDIQCLLITHKLRIKALLVYQVKIF